jgi:hypothetical protein
VAHPLFQAEGGGSTPTSALQLTLYPVSLDTAICLNRRWHSRLPRLDSRVANWCAWAAEFDGLYYGVGIWSLPIARALPQDGTWMELRRLAIAPDAPKNTASRMLRVMAMLVRRARPAAMRLVSYQDTEAHTGGIYRAAGWTMTDTSDSNTTWTWSGRPRPKAQSDAPKVRWEKPLS